MPADAPEQGLSTHQGKIALIALLKDPETLPVKTRLAADIGTRAAREFYEASLDTLGAQLGRFRARRWITAICHAPPVASTTFTARFASALLFAQGEGNLGHRLVGAQRDLCDHLPAVTIDLCVFIGGDSPDLSDERLLALAASCTMDAAIIPATDGGFVALACRAPLPDLSTARWSHRSTLQDVLAILSQPGREVAVLEPWYDVDETADLVALTCRLQGAGKTPSHLLPLRRICEKILAEHNECPETNHE